MAKKEWLSASIFNNGFKENIRNTQQIFWDSSSSEDEYLQKHSLFNKRKRTKHSQVNCRISPVISFKKSNLILTHSENDKIDQSVRTVDSPIVELRRLDLYELSPELSQRSTSTFGKETSPVIVKRRVRLKLKKAKSKESSCVSPDLFDIKYSQNITNESPNFSDLSSQATVNIELYPSQFGSQVDPASLQMQGNELYYEPPKRKKNYKKGGLAYQLDKALKIKKSRIQIWHHEKVNNIEGGFEEQGDIIRFKLEKVWNEYGNTLLCCELVNKSVSNNKNESESDSLVDNRVCKDNLFLLNAGTSCILNIDWKIDNIYELFPPYNIDRVYYCGQYVPYYSNASKLVSSNL